MRTKRQITKRDLAHIHRNISSLKKDFLQLRKILQQQKLSDFPLIKSREVRKMLRISSSTLQVMRNKGQIPYTRIGGQLLYEYSDVRNILIKGKNNKQ